MQILKPSYPLIVELTEEDITLMHLAFYEYEALLKHNKRISAAKKRKWIKVLHKMINLVDLLI